MKSRDDVRNKAQRELLRLVNADPFITEVETSEGPRFGWSLSLFWETLATGTETTRDRAEAALDAAMVNKLQLIASDFAKSAKEFLKDDAVHNDATKD